MGKTQVIRQVIALALLTIILCPIIVKASYTTEYTREYNYTPTGVNNLVQNRLDPNATNNRDSWDPVPSGVYVGGYSVESKMRLSVVPDSNCSISLAQVMRFEGSQIMSGGSYFIVRLPVSDTYDKAYLDIYEIEPGTNWSFVQNITKPSGSWHERNDMRINFTQGNYSLVYFSNGIVANDTSPTNGNFYYTRSNRTYAMVRCPIRTDQYYLFVTTAKYLSDAYVEVYWQPESLTGAWNRSTLATYNLIDPDTFVLAQENFNISLGYSWDFREGFGAGMCGYNKYMESGSQVNFYHKMEKLDLNNYLTFMFPFVSNLDNISIRTRIEVFSLSTGDYEWIVDDTSEWNDFILISTPNVLDTEIPAGWKASWEGWIRYELTFLNETRFRFFMRDLFYEHPEGFTQSWYGHPVFAQRTLIHAPGYRWDPQHFFIWNDTSGEYDWVFWKIQAISQLNNYKWTQSAAKTDSQNIEPKDWEDMNFLEKNFFLQGKFLITMGETISLLYPPAGYAITVAGMSAVLVAEYGNLPDPFGFLTDGLNWIWDKLRGFGQWLYKVGQSIVGAIKWFVEQLIYYGSVILGIFILITAFIVLFTPMYFTAKVGMMIRKAALGDVDGAMGEISKLRSDIASLKGGK